MNILLVDDDPSNLALLRVLLESEGHATAGAANGVEALALALEARPDLIISDILMPVMDGFALCRAWMREPLLKEIPFIFYTATYTSEEDEAFCLSLGAAAFLQKFMAQDAFLAQVQQILESVGTGALKPPDTAPMEGEPFLKLYNERLIRKLDERSSQLSQQLAALQQSEAALRLKSAALEAAINGVVITDREGTILWGNSALATLTGYSLDELLGQNFRILRSGAHNETFYVQVWKTILAGRTWRGEMVNQRKDRSLYTEELTITPIVDDQGEVTHFTAIKRDITEMKRVEDDLRHAQKMEAVGRLAGGMAHDFNNMLNVILLNAEVSLLSNDLPEHHRMHLLEIQQAGLRSSDLTRQLLTFSRKHPADPRKLDLNQLIAEDLKMLHRLVGEDIALTFTPGPGLWSVLMDPSQVSQILANLLINARDAIPGQGSIALATANVHTDDDAFAPGVLPPGDYVLLTLSDSGCGMDAATLERAFEPFFTTKPLGRGTGMGLATVYGIVAQSLGSITAHSHPGVGTTMKICLPRCSIDAPEEARALELAAPRGAETILVAEDELPVLVILKRTLEDLGYQVLAAPTPTEACALAEGHGGPIHLLLTDVVMPGMNGQELQRQILARRPALKTLFMSGHTLDTLSSRGLLGEVAHFIQKPFRILDLAKKVRETLDACFGPAPKG